MKSLAKVVIGGWLVAASWGAPAARADDTKSVEADACSQAAATQSPQDSASAPATASVPDPSSGSEERGGVSGLFWKWFRMGERIQAEQPNWLSPMATTSGRLKQELRFDVWQQPGTRGGTDYNFGGGKGLEFIVAPRTQLLIGVPPYVEHTGGVAAPAPNGFADIPLMIKFRIAAAAAGEGDYLVTLLLGATVPAGPNGMRDAVLSPGIAIGKGWGRIDVQSTLGGNLPTGDTAALGRQLVSNTALQYRMPWNLWPEVEENSTFFLVGKEAGRTQVFLAPGLGFGRVRLWRALRFSAGAGVQIAATSFHTYNHRGMFSVRCSF
jgi:hypothetical protein